ncbi:hypothetical protein K4U03_00120 [Staphylococcus epidermidis]|nr:hypothetical protein [Staphylococcus epidermidis]
MKKVLFLIFASLLVLGACGQKEEKKEKDNKTETTKKDEKKETQKKTENKKENKEDKTKEDTVNNEQQSNEQQTNEQQVEPQQAQEQQANQQQEPSYEEQMRANAKVAKQNGYTGIPNGDMGGVPTSDKAYSNDQLDPETGLPKDDAVPQDTE